MRFREVIRVIGWLYYLHLCHGSGTLIDSAVHAHSGGVRCAQHHRIGSSRNYRILRGTCRLPGG